MNLIAAPILLPLLVAMILIFVRGNLLIQRLLSGVVAVAMPLLGWTLWQHVDAHGIQVLRIGSWPASYGIMFVADRLSAIMLFFAGITHLATWLFLVAARADAESESKLLHPLLLCLAGGVNWAFSTGDLFNLFVSFEIILMASYVLMIHGNTGPQVREAFKFVILNMVAGMLFLAAAGFAYGLFGTLNMAELAVRIELAGYPPESIVLGVLLGLVFGMKAAVFPLFFWLPDAYPKAPPGVLGYFSGILTKVGVYCLYRTFPLFFDLETFVEWFQPTILAIGGLTMVIGVFGAFSQYTMRRILCFHIISQIGYMIFGLGLFTISGLAFGIFYIIHNMVVKSALLFMADTVILMKGTDDLKKVRGLISIHPIMAVLFLLVALSLAGIPPLSGFYGKMGFAIEGLREGQGLYVFLALFTGLFTLASMVKIWRYSFWGEASQIAKEQKHNGPLIPAASLLVAVSLVVAVGSGWLVYESHRAGESLMERTEYIQACLGQPAPRAFVAQVPTTAATPEVTP